jgi:hypothetical protein
MHRWSELNYPSQVSLELNGVKAVFSHAGDGKYSVQVGGEPRAIRKVRQVRIVSENGWSRSYDPESSQGDQANIDAILKCIQLRAERTPLPNGLHFSAIDEWGHFRQNTFLHVSLTIADDGALEIREDIDEQDESYY